MKNSPYLRRTKARPPIIKRYFGTYHPCQGSIRSVEIRPPWIMATFKHRECYDGISLNFGSLSQEAVFECAKHFDLSQGFSFRNSGSAVNTCCHFAAHIHFVHVLCYEDQGNHTCMSPYLRELIILRLEMHSNLKN